MLVDKLRFSIPWDVLGGPEKGRELRDLIGGDRLMCICPTTGHIRWESSRWQSLDSGAHTVQLQVGALGLKFDGSPGRAIGDGDAVFAGGASANLDVVGCMAAMWAVARAHVDLPAECPFKSATVTWVDVTRNILFESAADASDYIAILKSTEGPRYRRAFHDSTMQGQVWGKNSTHKAFKVYLKGPEIRKKVVKRDYSGRAYTAEELEICDRLVRHEIMLRRRWWSKREPWWAVSSDELRSEFEEYLGRMVGDMKFAQSGALREKVMAVAPSAGQGRAAMATWHAICNQGMATTREDLPRATWYRHLKILRAAGLADADFNAGDVVRFRQATVQLRAVDSWAEALAA